MKINTISPDKHKYLQIIDTIAKKPQTLDYIGKLPEERITSVAIVGTRKPTPYGREVGHMLSYELAKRGIIVISGLALGVDAIAHRGALEAGGTTLAVLANGLDSVYPSSHRDLATQIISQGGALISEYEPHERPRLHYFLERNRIISGLADAVIIVEAASKSGTLNTAAHALEQGREVFAVPGNITNPLSSGCNRLLKQGAHPVTCVEDILEVISPESLRPQTILPLGTTTAETTIIQLLQKGLRDGDALQKTSNLTASEFNQTLTMLEINGVIRSLGGNQWALR